MTCVVGAPNWASGFSDPYPGSPLFYCPLPEARGRGLQGLSRTWCSSRWGTSALIPPSQEQAELTVRACELRAKEEKLAAEREALERERQELRLEKDRLHKASLRLQARAQELEHMSKVCLRRAVG